MWKKGASRKTEKPLVVTTAHRGVFFGYAVPSDDPTITLRDARMCVYWPVDTHGVCGLANAGPSIGAKISPKVSRLILQNVTSVMVCSPEAVIAWESEPWS